MITRDGRPQAAPLRARIAGSRVVRLGTIAVLIVVASIAVGAASHPHSVEFSFSAPDIGSLATLVLLAAAGALGLILGTQLFPVWVLDAPRAPAAIDRSRRLPAIARAIITLVPIMLVAFFLASTRRFSSGAGTPTPPHVTGQFPPAGSAGAQGTDVFLVASTFAVAVAAFLLASFIFRRPPQVEATPSTGQEAAAEILDEGLSALLAERDPRKAVVGAYVAMERAMARKGFARRPHEAPTEYLAHVLGVAPSRAGDLDELVGLYEYARFSEHTVTASMRDAAVDSVRRLREDLREPV